MKYRIFLCAATSLLLTGCFGEKEHKDSTTSVDKGFNSELPSTLKNKSSKTASADDSYMISPLQKELKQLGEQEVKLNQELMQYAQQRKEYALREQEIRNTLVSVKARRKKVGTVIEMINQNDPSFNSIAAQGADNSGSGLEVPSITDRGPSSSDLPALSSDNNNLGGGPQMDSLAPSFGGTTTPRNELNTSGSDVPTFSMNNFETPEFEAAPAFPAASANSNPAPGSVWKSATAAPSMKNTGKVLAWDGKGLDSLVMISLGSKDGITEGMKFETSSADGKRNVLVVTRVFNVNAEAKLVPGMSSGSLVEGAALKKVTR